MNFQFQQLLMEFVTDLCGTILGYENNPYSREEDKFYEWGALYWEMMGTLMLLQMTVKETIKTYPNY